MEVVKLTESASIKLTELLKNENKNFLKIDVTGGGCSGLSYKLSMSNSIESDSVEWESMGCKLYTTKKSMLYLINTQMDYSDGLNGKGFEFSNPNASRTCACGESFGV